MNKLKESVRHVLDHKGASCRNAVDITAALPSRSLYKFIPEAEFMKLQQCGFEDAHQELLDQLDALKCELASFVEEGIHSLSRRDTKELLMQEWLVCKLECPLRRRKRLHRIFETLWKEAGGRETGAPPRAPKRDVASVIGGR